LPSTEVIIFAEDDGSAPLMEWLEDSRSMQVKARDKCIVTIERLKERGHELRRPEADYLERESYELRAKLGHVHYRMLYFFHAGKAVISHGITKEGAVPDSEIDLAVQRKAMFARNPSKHTYLE
jgi:phage-related protein